MSGLDTTLAAHEQVIERSLGSFVEVAAALMAIRDGKLYRAGHPTFESYCQHRWKFSRQRAHQLMEAAAVSTMVDIQNERQARAFTGLTDEPEVMAEIVERAKEMSPSRPPTASTLRRAREEIRPPAPPKPPPVIEHDPAAADAFIGSSGAYQLAQYRQAFVKAACVTAHSEFDVKRVALALDDPAGRADLANKRAMARDYLDFLDRVIAAQPKALRSVR